MRDPRLRTPLQQALDGLLSHKGESLVGFLRECREWKAAGRMSWRRAQRVLMLKTDVWVSDQILRQWADELLGPTPKV